MIARPTLRHNQSTLQHCMVLFQYQQTTHNHSPQILVQLVLQRHDIDVTYPVKQSDSRHTAYAPLFDPLAFCVISWCPYMLTLLLGTYQAYGTTQRWCMHCYIAKMSLSLSECMPDLQISSTIFRSVFWA